MWRIFMSICWRSLNAEFLVIDLFLSGPSWSLAQTKVLAYLSQATIAQVHKSGFFFVGFVNEF